MSTPPPPPPEFLQAVNLFNREEFFECHEVLEELWNMVASDEEKNFYQGLLQIGVGFYHCQQNNSHGAKTLIHKGLEKLTPLANQTPFCYWIDLTHVIQAGKNFLTHDQTWATIDFPKISVN